MPALKGICMVLDAYYQTEEICWVSSHSGLGVTF